MKHLFIIFISILALGCTPVYRIDQAISNYDKVADQISLGQTKKEVLSILLMGQRSLPGTTRKRPEQYIKEKIHVEIYYMRTGRQPDGLTTDDEFTPYIFNDGILVAIGWNFIGGPKSEGKVVQPAPVFINNQKTIVY